MVQCRLLTERACRLRNERRSAGLCDASMGQEAIATGCAIDLRPEDTIVPAPRDSIAGLVEGRPAGRHRGSVSWALHAHRISAQISAPRSIAVARRHVALVNKRKKNSNVVVAFTSSQQPRLIAGTKRSTLPPHESLPIIFVVENNPWADPASLPARNGVDGFALKARNYGLPAITVDGNDVVAVYRVACESLQAGPPGRRPGVGGG